MAKTNIDLVDFAKKALKENWGYCLGTYGNILTPAYLKQKQSQGGGVGTYNTRHNAYLQKFINKRVSDCYGLVKGYVWWQGDGKNPAYIAKQDRNQEGAYSTAKEKGPLSTLPEIPGIILWMKGHAGIYIGNGEFIEIVGAPVGMRKGKIVNGKVTVGSKFSHWFKDTYISYEGGGIVVAYKRGDAGAGVKALQEDLIKAGYNLAPHGADGSFGPAMDTIVRQFQRDNGLVVDGSFGPASQAKLKELLANLNTPVTNDKENEQLRKENRELKDKINKIRDLIK